MRIINGDIVNASCFTTMEEKDVNGGPVPVTDLKYSPTNNDATNSNGILSPPTTPSASTPSENEYNPSPSSNSNSGRFKFYKDGKFILELWHHKNGERMFWIPVTKNSTCWPPMGPCTPRQESSTSLSVSDDNSSIQSSPWQRDHCWKQAVPRKNINRQLEFTMHVLRPRKMRFSSAAIRRRQRRRPYEVVVKCYDPTAAAAKYRAAGAGHHATVHEADAAKLPALPVKTEAAQSAAVTAEQPACAVARTRRRLSDVLQKLLERRAFDCAPGVGSCRTDPGIVSPRKRILKELEKVSLEELGNANKKHRARTVFGGSGAVAPCATVPAVTAPTGAAAPVAFGGAAASATSPPSAAVKSANSHSISSILSRDEEQPSFLRNLLKSPTDGAAVGASVGAASPVAGVEARDLAADLRGGLRSARCSTPSVAALASPPPLASSVSATALYPTAAKGLPQQPSPPLHPPPPLPMYITPAFLYHSGPQPPFMASPPVSNHPPYYPAFAAAGFRDTNPMWPVPSVSSLGRQSVYPSTSLLSPYPPLNPSPWVPVVPSSLQTYPVTENGTGLESNASGGDRSSQPQQPPRGAANRGAHFHPDVPLNLSKH